MVGSATDAETQRGREGEDNSAPRAGLIRKIGSWLLVLPSALIGVILVELYCQLFLPARYTNNVNNNQRLIFFDGRGTIFENHGDIFSFVPHDDIRNVVAFFSPSSFSVEYDTRFHTNNFGLVQDNDVLPGPDSVLVVGDSFGQGLGAEPWFRLISPEIDQLGYQPVNGALLGTGFAQWRKLEQRLIAGNIRIAKMVVVFISDDFQRQVWNATPAQFSCFTALAQCDLEKSFFYRLPPQNELASWVDKIRTARAPLLHQSWLGARAAAWLPATYHAYRYLKESYYGEQHQNTAERQTLARAEDQSREAIAEFVRTYGASNVIFVHIPQKDEIGKPDKLGIKARQAIEAAGGHLVDGFQRCGLTETDYYPRDDHPTPAGYAKVARCVGDAIKEMTSGG